MDFGHKTAVSDCREHGVESDSVAQSLARHMLGLHVTHHNKYYSTEFLLYSSSSSSSSSSFNFHSK